ncbi:hypothetical protein PR048_019058, partial [Dryococelus australis]
MEFDDICRKRGNNRQILKRVRRVSAQSKLVAVNNRGTQVLKPWVVVEYNKAKSFIDLSDQMSSYSTTLRRTIKWYHKIVFEILFGTAIVNAFVLYNIRNKGFKPIMKITKFRELLALHLLQVKHPEPATSVPLPDEQQTSAHRLVSTDPARTARRRCSGCYRRFRTSEDRNTDSKK